jgi:hypothetical protein
MFRDRVRERDLDHFLIEELHSSSQFRRWFLDRVGGSFEPPQAFDECRVERAARRTGDGRETDVRISFLQGDKVSGEILIENKVTDDFQEGQAESYAREVALRRTELGNVCVAAVLIAPEARMRSLLSSALFDCTITVEAISEYLGARIGETTDDELARRLAVKAELLDAIAGKRQTSRWIPSTIQEKRDFAARYEELARELVPGFRVRPSTDGPKALTRFFDRFPLQDDFPCRVSLKHEFGSNVPVKYVNLQFDGRADALAVFTDTRGIFPADGTIFPMRGGKSLMIRIATPGLIPEGDRFDEQREKVTEGLRAVLRLSQWLERHGSQILELLRAKPLA